MPKAIKHIKAGLLNIEVLGNIPERTGRRRAARTRATPPAQQFYNNKCSWRELELKIAANFGTKDYVITMTYDDEYLPKNKKEANILFQKFIRKLRRVRKRRNDSLKYIYVTEGQHGRQESDYFEKDSYLEDKRIHHHVVINYTGSGDLDEIRSLWDYGDYIRSEPVDIHYYRELAKYLTKEAREFNQQKPGERMWKASMNLEEYEVEYIEIHTDSITLAPPYGAVDYISFKEKNPYGYADSIGARYLMFPKKENPMYSYTRGRNGTALYNLKP